MTIKLNSLDRWNLLPAGKSIVLPGGSAERRVRLHVNLSQATRLYVELDGGEVRLLSALAGGLETIEFSVAGDCRVFASEDDTGETWFQTAEHEPTFVEVPDPIIFTKLAERRHRNPEMEEMMWLMQRNVERRLQLQAAETAAALEAQRHEYERRLAGEPSAGEPPAAADGSGEGEVSAPIPATDGSAHGGAEDGGGSAGPG